MRTGGGSNGSSKEKQREDGGGETWRMTTRGGRALLRLPTVSSW